MINSLITVIPKQSIRCIWSTTSVKAMAPGTLIEGLDFLKGAEPVVSKERSEYPEWVCDLATPDITLAKLKKMDEADASDNEKRRYLKLTRRNTIKDSNVDAGLR
mmetsp:Transcript_23964/g.36502  ORF Transcript_23964/g.36502 Transcript_23964/m.36502 type:complete len:105 (+) Transcript_23964:64-378(+)